MHKLDMKNKDIINDNIEYIAKKFPNVLIEDANGFSINFELLKQELSKEIIEDDKDKYELTWPGKKKSILNANSISDKTLRLIKEKSFKFEKTSNVIIEGDNLDALKIIQESYLGKIKMIYIDPPYNTGNDFIYNDKFERKDVVELYESGQIDELDNRLITNNESNGRFHSDWLSMMYPRLKLARNLLREDGIIFISIDENEVHNLRKICDEIFGEKCFVSQIGWQKVYAPKNQARYFSNDYEFILCYSKNIDEFSVGELPRTAEMNARYKNPDNDPRGDWKPGDCVGNGVRKNGYYDVVSPTGKIHNVPEGKHWVYAPETMKQLIKENKIWWGKDGNSFPAVKQFLSEVSGRKASNLFSFEDYGHTDMAKKDLIKLFDEFEKVPFDTPKPVKLLKMLLLLGTGADDIVLDFFAGSGTMGQAVMELNAEKKEHRKYVLIQMPEKIINNKTAQEKGIETIADVCEERIRRAAKKMEENNSDIDCGFRVYKVDSSNMKDIYYMPNELKQNQLKMFESNIKEDRNAEDLLIQIILDLGLMLDMKITEKNILNNKVYFVDDNSLIACFDNEININVVDEICKYNPLKVVFKDESFKLDNDKINLQERFKKLSPNTEISIL